MILQAAPLASTLPGVIARWFLEDPAGDWDSNLALATTLDAYTATATNIQAQIAWGDDSPFTAYAGFDNGTAQFKGLIHVTTAGTYMFSTYSDDGSVLWLDTGSGMTEIVNNRRPHGMMYQFSSQITLAQGDYPFVAAWYDSGGQGGMYLMWDPGTGRVTIPAANLLHVPEPATLLVLGLAVPFALRRRRAGNRKNV
jgi:hypothetical protein